MQTVLDIGTKNYSSWSLWAWRMRRESHLVFGERRCLLEVDTTAEELAALGAAMRIPVLEIGDEHIWDSLAIAETVAERWPDKGLWPADQSARAHARSISAEMHSGFEALRTLKPMNCRARGRRVTLTDELTADIDRIVEIWSDCFHRYDGEWLFGDFSIADAMYAPVVLRLRTYGINLPESASYYPRRLLKCPAMQEWLSAAECENVVIEQDEVGQ